LELKTTEKNSIAIFANIRLLNLTNHSCETCAKIVQPTSDDAV